MKKNGIVSSKISNITESMAALNLLVDFLTLELTFVTKPNDVRAIFSKKGIFQLAEITLHADDLEEYKKFLKGLNLLEKTDVLLGVYGDSDMGMMEAHEIFETTKAQMNKKSNFIANQIGTDKDLSDTRRIVLLMKQEIV
jgi:cell division GTPase FtsZ